MRSTIRINGITATDRVSAYRSFSFDSHIEEFFPSLAAGATVYIIPEESRIRVRGLMDLIERFAPILKKKNKLVQLKASTLVERAVGIHQTRFPFHHIELSTPILENESPDFEINYNGCEMTFIIDLNSVINEEADEVFKLLGEPVFKFKHEIMNVITTAHANHESRLGYSKFK